MLAFLGSISPYSDMRCPIRFDETIPIPWEQLNSKLAGKQKTDLMIICIGSVAGLTFIVFIHYFFTIEINVYIISYYTVTVYFDENTSFSR